MNYNFKIEQAFSGKITATGTGWAVALNMDQVNGLGIDVNSLENFDPVAFKRAYLLEETINPAYRRRSQSVTHFSVTCWSSGYIRFRPPGGSRRSTC